MVLIFHDITERKRAEQDLRQQREWLSVTLRSIGDAVIATDVEGRVSFLNPAAVALTGWQGEEVLGQPVIGVFNIINEKTRQPGEDLVARVLREKRLIGLANHTALVAKDGREIPIEDSAAPILDGTGNVAGAVLVFHDVTQRRRAQEALREAHDRAVWLARFPEQNPNPTIRASADGTILYCNPASAGINGWRCEVGRVLQDDLRPLVTRVMSEGKEIQEDILLGGRFYIVWVAPFPTEGYANVYGRDITARKQTEDALQRRTLELQHLTETLEQRVKERTAELEALSSELLVAQEKERRRISQDLHDNIWQTLETIKFRIEALCHSQGGGATQVCQRQSRQISAAITDAVTTIRTMQGELWPSVLDDLGITAAINSYCRDFEKNHPGITVKCRADLPEPHVSSSVKIAAYRVLQEAMNNVAKHSRATEVTLSLMKYDQMLEFRIKDNGVGFDMKRTMMKKNPWAGLGLVSMRGRTEHSGGKLFIDSAVGQGTTIRASWPLTT